MAGLQFQGIAIFVYARYVVPTVSDIVRTKYAHVHGIGLLSLVPILL